MKAARFSTTIYAALILCTSAFANNLDNELTRWKDIADQIPTGTSLIEIERQLPVCQYLAHTQDESVDSKGIRLLSYPKVVTTGGAGKILSYQVAPEIMISVAFDENDFSTAPIQIKRNKTEQGAAANP